jgi:carbon-monoxide dehydrogenase large subunit
MDIAGYDELRREQAEKRARGELMGIGIAFFTEGVGAGPRKHMDILGLAMNDGADLRVHPSGKAVVSISAQTQGQGHETTFAQIVSKVLGIPVDRVRLRTSEPEHNFVANPTGGSRTLHGLGSAMHWASLEVAKNGMDLAAEHLESALQDIEFDLGTYRIKGTDRKVRIDELAKKYPGRLDLDFRDRPKVPATFPNGCHIAEVEIDPETGECDIVSYVACDDVGNIINHQIVEGQMQGGITQGAGHIFLEQGVYDAAGQLLTGSFMDYAMPRAGLVGGLTVTDHAVPTATNPLGAKGVGEGGVTGSMPALMNALMDALRSAGVKEFDMPASPQRLWSALQAARR